MNNILQNLFSGVVAASQISEQLVDSEKQVEPGNEVLFDDIMDERVVPSTKKFYKGAIKYLTKVCKNHDNLKGALDKEGHLKVPMDLNMLKSLFGELSKSDEDGKCKAFSTIQTYVSALKYLYRLKKVVFDKNACDDLKEFACGLKRIIAQKKTIGTMKSYEGTCEYCPSRCVLFYSVFKL